LEGLVAGVAENISRKTGKKIPETRKKIVGIRENYREHRVMREVLTGLAKRRLTDVATVRFTEEPVLVLNGPRTVGKSTLLSQLAARLGRVVYRL
jgi:predicted AAA+ superfamily ATPase